MPKQSPQKNKVLRVAFIGAGGIAGAHLEALKPFEDVQVVALADITPQSMHAHADKYGIDRATCYTDYKQMLRAVKPDAVNVCTPNKLHAPAAIDALKAGAHVIVEKPMAMNAGECRKMIAAAQQAKKKLLIGFQLRFDRRSQFLCDLRDKGVFGDIRFGRVQALRRRGIPNWGVFGRKDLQGGGPLIDIGVHALEMCHYTMGNPRPVAAVGFAETYLGNDKQAAQIKTDWPNWDYQSYTVEDLAVGHIRFDNGAVIHIESSFAAHHEHQGLLDFQIMGTKGGAKWSTSEVFTDQHGYQVNLTPAFLPDDGGFAGGFTRKNRDFVDHVLYNKPTNIPAEHGLMVQQMLDAIYQSAERGGKEVAIRS